ncbi:DUF5696 domain-containing protein [Paenibacillus humicola]|uniref:DUF5696 domain-containing protein n=1 Tax=Paenibacillus humicola TaxID=3110540 RepID=UPI00237C21E7|nr:DUF5696 domain-containing protein [Paenibacillus humicola]
MSRARTASALTAVCLALAMIAGCAGSKSAGQAENKGQAAAAAALTKGRALSASFTDSRVAGMKGIAESDRLRLFVDEQTGGIAVLIKRSGEIWYSNPPERGTDSLASGVNKDLLSAQLKIDFYNHFGQINSINSYTDSVAHKQLQFEAIPGGVRVTYQFGTAEKTADDMPKMLSKARFEELTGKMDKTGQRALKIAYTEDPEKGLYTRNDDALKGLQLGRALKAFESVGYTEKDLEKDIAALKLNQTKPEPRIFRASIEYTLDNDSLVVNIPVSRILYPSEYPVNAVSVLSFFGAVGQEGKGAIFVPDGSGALIHFNNGKTKYPAYRQLVYGKDLTTDTTEDPAREEAIRLPVFGLIREGGAFLGIVEKGAPVATINADVGGRLNSYNYVYPSFNVVNEDEITLDANGQQRSLPRFQEHPMKSDFTVRYAFLSGKDASYQGMATYYQQYLQERGGLPKLKKADQAGKDIPFYLQLVGSISKKKHIVGIPYRALEPLTTFEQAKSILTEAQQRGIRNIKLQYAGWFNGGLDHKVPDRVAVDGTVGGSGGLKDLVSFTQGKGISLFPDVAVLTAHTGAGFKESKEAARSLRGVPAARYPLDPALNRRDRNKPPSYVVAPRLVGSYVDSMLRDFGRYRTGGISLRDMADELNSDYRKHNQIDRTESEGILVKALERIRDQGLDMMANGGNAYALPFLTDITNAPLTDSRFKIEDEEVPFFQMVVHGFIDYTGAPYNLSTYTDASQYMLKCLEYGAGVYFEWTYAPNYEVQDTEYNDLYAVNYKQWMNEAADMYRKVNGVLKDVQNKRIVSHEKLSDGVFRTDYDNGFYIIVNYNRAQVQVDGRPIEAESYVTGGGES